MKRTVIAAAGVVGILLAGPHTGSRASESDPADQCLSVGDNARLKAGCDALDAFMRTFNARDGKAWAATLNYPHARLAAGQLKVWETAADYALSNDVAELAKAQGWHHSKWTARRLVQDGDDKLHFATKFTRFDKDDRALGTYDSLYIVTRKDGHWGTQFRSSYAGIVGKKTAF